MTLGASQWKNPAQGRPLEIGICWRDYMLIWVYEENEKIIDCLAVEVKERTKSMRNGRRQTANKEESRKNTSNYGR